MAEFFEEDNFESTKLDKSIWKKLIKYMMPHKKYVIIAAISIMITATLDAVYPLMTSYAIDEIIEVKNLGNLKYFIVFFILFIFTQIFSVIMFIKSAGKVEAELAYDIRRDAFNKLQKLPFAYYDKTPVGWIMARMTSDSRNLSEILSWGIVDLVWGLVLMFFIVIFMFIVNWKLALIAIAVVPIMALVSKYFEVLVLKAYRKVRKINSKITGSFNEGITGAKTIKTLVLEDKSSKEFNDLTTSMRKQSIRAHMINAIFFPSVIFLSTIATCLVYYFGGNLVFIGVIDVATLYIFVNYCGQFFDPVYNLATLLSRMQQAQASAERILSLIETNPAIYDDKEVINRYGDTFDLKKENFEELVGKIEFRNVGFKYDIGEQVLENFNLTIKAGEKVALVGHTGAGKSTIVNLLSRFYEPVDGEILIDDKNYKERSIAWLHKNIGYVLQTPHLFSGTIMENVRYGNLNASDEDVYKACKLVNADEFISKFEKGYDTEVGESGNKLSVGQKQLLSFARAIITDPKIIILDEATSSVDTETEFIIQKAIDKILVGRTSVIVAHRLSTIVSCDRILVLEDGKIIEEGNHKDLIKKQGKYYQLYTNQFTQEMLEMSKN